MRKYLVIFAALLAFVVTASAGATSHTAKSPSDIYATPQFYTDYEHLTVHYVVGWDNSCVMDEYGYFSNPDCDSMQSNDAEYDVHVYQTRPRLKLVHSERDQGFSGTDSIDLFWSYDLRAPDCYSGKNWYRSYKAVIRLYSPVNGRVLAHDTETFSINCS